jgi:hypothetical protein
MRVKNSSAIIACLCFVVSLFAQQQDVGIYGRSARNIWGVKESVITSPDGKSAILVKAPSNSDSGETHSVSVKSNRHTYKTNIGAWVNAEATWSPDSKAFFITYSDGGNVGTYHTKVFYITDAGIRSTEPIPNGRRLFPPRCFDKEFPNVGAIKWLGKDSSRLLIAVQVPPHSSCASMGTFRAFKITLPEGVVVNQYDQLEAKRLFRDDIGQELQGADDACVRTPKNCLPVGLTANREQ